MSLWLVRHARPLVAAGVCYGALDVAADAQATQQAACALAQVLPQAATMRTSPLQRCTQLAQALQALRPDLRFTTDVRLAEMNFGCHEGQRWAHIAAQAYDAWTANFWQHRFGGAECVAQLMARVASAWDDAQGCAVDQVWITHAGVLRAAALLASGVRQIERADQWPLAAPGFGAWSQVSDTAHCQQRGVRAWQT